MKCGMWVLNYLAVLVLTKALTPNSTRSSIQKTLTMPQFSVEGATGVIQFQGSDRRNGTITIVTVCRNCNSSGFVLRSSDQPVVFSLEVLYLRKLRGSNASRKPSPSKLNANTVRIINTAGGQINQGCKTIIEALLAKESILPQEGSGC